MERDCSRSIRARILWFAIRPRVEVEAGYRLGNDRDTSADGYTHLGCESQRARDVDAPLPVIGIGSGLAEVVG